MTLGLAVAGVLLAVCLTAAVPGGIRADFAALHRVAAERFGEAGRQAVRDWEALLLALRPDPITVQLEQVNRFVNLRLRYAEDSLAWGQEDYWATPLEALGRGLGDCEDSAFTKYVSLLQLGVPDERLRLTYVRARYLGQLRAHMVLSYYPAPDVEPLILDSLIGELLPASQRPDLFPIFSFNTSALWVGNQGSPATATPAASLSNWRAVLERMRQEGWK